MYIKLKEIDKDTLKVGDCNELRGRGMKVKNFLNVMRPTRRYKVICNGLVAEFEPDETLPDIIAAAEVIR